MSSDDDRGTKAFLQYLQDHKQKFVLDDIKGQTFELIVRMGREHNFDVRIEDLRNIARDASLFAGIWNHDPFP
jgi:hypothetical protein